MFYVGVKVGLSLQSSMSTELKGRTQVVFENRVLRRISGPKSEEIIG
jgi:hypothetical protein